MGTPLYMSPEQARGEKVDGRADVYAFGVLCHELLTGQVPIGGESAIMVLMRHVMQAPPRASEVWSELKPELDAPILRMLEKDPAQRPATVGEALRELRQAAERAGYTIPDGMPSLPRPPRTTPPATSVTPRNSSPAAIGLGTDATYPETPRDVMVRSQGASARPRSVGWPFWLGVVVLGAGVTFLGTSGLRSNDWPTRGPAVSASQAAEPPPAAPVVASAAPAVSQPEPAPTSVEVTIKGAPNGAKVLLDDAQVGTAPGPISMPARQHSVELKVTAPGYEPATVTLFPDRSLTVDVTLKKRPAPARGKSTIPRDLESPF
jgi:serine/threonine-protein kinase